jgi:hypothetical protein
MARKIIERFRPILDSTSYGKEIIPVSILFDSLGMALDYNLASELCHLTFKMAVEITSRCILYGFLPEY